jgi:hypothetical protein
MNLENRIDTPFQKAFISWDLMRGILLSGQLPIKRVSEPQCELRYGKRRCGMAAGAEYGRSGGIKIANAPDAAVLIDDAVNGFAAHTGPAHLMTGCPGRRTERSPPL